MSCRHQIKRSAVEVRHPAQIVKCLPCDDTIGMMIVALDFRCIYLYLSVFPWPAPAASSDHSQSESVLRESWVLFASKASRLTFTPPPRSFPWPLGTPVSPVVVNGVLACLAACCNEPISVTT